MKSDSQILFKEEQRFRQWWIWVPLCAMSAFISYQSLTKYLTGSSLLGIEIWLPISLLLVVASLFFLIKLETIIDNKGISYRFSPLQQKWRIKEWNEIKYSWVRKYNPILEYGGWGIRIGFFGKGSAVNISGNMGLQLELTNGKKILIGTRKPEEMEKALKSSGKWNLA